MKHVIFSIMCIAIIVAACATSEKAMKEEPMMEEVGRISREATDALFAAHDEAVECMDEPDFGSPEMREVRRQAQQFCRDAGLEEEEGYLFVVGGRINDGENGEVMDESCYGVVYKLSLEDFADRVGINIDDVL